MHYLALYNASAVIRLPLVKRSSVDLAVKADYTPANGDCFFSKDGAAQFNPTNNLNIVTGTTWNITTNANDLACRELVVMVRNNTAVEDQWLTVRTYGNASAYYQWNMETGNLPADLRQIVGAAVSGPATAGVLDVNVKNVNNVAATTNLAVDLRQIVGAAVSGPATAGILDVNLKNVNNAAFNANLAQFGAAAISIANNAITALAFNANAITGAKVANDVDIRNVNGNVGSVTNNIGGNVAGSVGSVIGNVAAVTGNVGGNLAGSVGSVLGNVAAVTGNIGGNVAGSVGSVAGNVGAVTGNIGGSVAGSVGSVVSNVNTQFVANNGIFGASFNANAITGRAVANDVDIRNVNGNITGSVGSVLGNVGNVTGNIGGALANFNALAKAQVIAALADNYAEPGQNAPAASTSIERKIAYMYKLMRNQITQTNNTLSVFNDDATTVDQKATVSEVNGTYTRGEIESGP